MKLVRAASPIWARTRQVVLLMTAAALIGAVLLGAPPVSAESPDRTVAQSSGGTTLGPGYVAYVVMPNFDGYDTLELRASVRIAAGGRYVGRWECSDGSSGNMLNLWPGDVDRTYTLTSGTTAAAKVRAGPGARCAFLLSATAPGYATSASWWNVTVIVSDEDAALGGVPGGGAAPSDSPIPGETVPSPSPDASPDYTPYCLLDLGQGAPIVVLCTTPGSYPIPGVAYPTPSPSPSPTPAPYVYEDVCSWTGNTRNCTTTPRYFGTGAVVRAEITLVETSPAGYGTETLQMLNTIGHQMYCSPAVPNGYPTSGAALWQGTQNAVPAGVYKCTWTAGVNSGVTHGVYAKSNHVNGPATLVQLTVRYYIESGPGAPTPAPTGTPGPSPTPGLIDPSNATPPPSTGGGGGSGSGGPGGIGGEGLQGTGEIDGLGGGGSGFADSGWAAGCVPTYPKLGQVTLINVAEPVVPAEPFDVPGWLGWVGQMIGSLAAIIPNAIASLWNGLVDLIIPSECLEAAIAEFMDAMSAAPPFSWFGAISDGITASLSGGAGVTVPTFEVGGTTVDPGGALTAALAGIAPYRGILAGVVALAAAFALLRWLASIVGLRGGNAGGD